MRAPFPDPNTAHPLGEPNGDGVNESVVFLKAILDHPRLEVGEYTYASSFDPPQDWAQRLAPYLFEFSPERLVVGKFCQIADGALFITASANHRYDGISSYPFAAIDLDVGPHRQSLPGPGPDTIVGNDVWIGQGARILPGAQLGNGVIVGAGAVVSGSVPPYAIVAGNPARIVRMRFDQERIEMLQRRAWWDWPIDHILKHEAEICGGDVDALTRVAP